MNLMWIQPVAQSGLYLNVEQVVSILTNSESSCILLLADGTGHDIDLPAAVLVEVLCQQRTAPREWIAGRIAAEEASATWIDPYGPEEDEADGDA